MLPARHGLQLNHQPAHTISEFSLNYSDPSDRWSLNGYVKNIENHARKFGYDGMMGMQIGNPRTYGSVLSVNF